MKNNYHYFCKYIDNQGCVFSKAGQGETVRDIVGLFDDFHILEIEIKFRK